MYVISRQDCGSDRSKPWNRKGIALAMAREGATVVVNYNGSKERAEEVVAEIENAGGKAVAKQCNVSDFSQAKEFLQRL